MDHVLGAEIEDRRLVDWKIQIVDRRDVVGSGRIGGIISSIFVPFAMPVKIPLFEDIVKEKGSQVKTEKTKVF